MTAGVFTRIRQFRMNRAHARQRVFGAACVAAANNGDMAQATVFLSRMHDAQEERDHLRALLAAPCPPCNHNCNEGRDCPARR